MTKNVNRNNREKQHIQLFFSDSKMYQSLLLYLNKLFIRDKLYSTSAELRSDQSYLHPQKSHDNGVDCTKNTLRVKGLRGLIHFLSSKKGKGKNIREVFGITSQQPLWDLWCGWCVRRSYSARGVSVHVFTKHPSINVTGCTSSAVWVKAVVADATSSQIPSDD